MDIRRIFGTPPQQENEAVEIASSQLQTKAEGLKVEGLLGLSSTDSLEIAEQQAPSPVLNNLPIDSQQQETDLPNVEQMPFFEIDKSRVFHTTTLAMIMNYLGVPVLPEEVVKATDTEGESPTPNEMIEYARDKGLEAEGYNNGTVEELKGFIDKGIPVQAIIEHESGDFSYYIAITGYGVDNSKDPPEEYIVYRDGKIGEGRMPMSEFEKSWSAGQPTGSPGYSNYFMAFGPEGSDLPPGRDEGIEAISTFWDGASDMVKGLFDRLINGDGVGERIHGFFQTIGGFTGAVAGGLGWLFGSGPAQWLSDKVEGVPVLENIVQPITDLWDTAGSVVADVFGGIGDAFDTWGGAFESLAAGNFSDFGEGMWEGVKDIGGGVVDGVVDTVEGIVDSVGDIFSGW